MNTLISRCFITWKIWKTMSLKCPLLETSQEILHEQHFFLDLYVGGIFLRIKHCSSSGFSVKIKTLVLKIPFCGISLFLPILTQLVECKVHEFWSQTTGTQSWLSFTTTPASLGPRLLSGKMADHPVLLQGSHKIIQAKCLGQGLLGRYTVIRSVNCREN